MKKSWREDFTSSNHIIVCIEKKQTTTFDFYEWQKLFNYIIKGIYLIPDLRINYNEKKKSYVM